MSVGSCRTSVLLGCCCSTIGLWGSCFRSSAGRLKNCCELKALNVSGVALCSQDTLVYEPDVRPVKSATQRGSRSSGPPTSIAPRGRHHLGHRRPLHGFLQPICSRELQQRALQRLELLAVPPLLRHMVLQPVVVRSMQARY